MRRRRVARRVSSAGGYGSTPMEPGNIILLPKSEGRGKGRGLTFYKHPHPFHRKIDFDEAASDFYIEVITSGFYTQISHGGGALVSRYFFFGKIHYSFCQRCSELIKRIFILGRRGFFEKYDECFPEEVRVVILIVMKREMKQQSNFTSLNDFHKGLNLSIPLRKRLTVLLNEPSVKPD
ncbi:hypothetical protein TNIN_323941 [Trichonephila inaurata madagascariensis]|uniref:Uncharacterized protein n=1 Tax=Trichonephila inaurata madagascariensis TaxID=2747483 RepID=A0A8X6IET3_9ARAC|nr:hypothetical protein TNIN_323941 [Trichonephila inaurata madagascariensis]